jgi:hypothetical protein
VSPRALAIRTGGLIRGQPLIFAILAVWAFAPLTVLLLYTGAHGGTPTGASGSDAFDQLAYLAWIRDEGSHLLASNLWQVTPSAHDYLHPMFVISGLLWRLGLSVQLAYMVWKPVALIVLFAGFAAYARHLLGDSRREQGAALALGLFYVTPVLALAVWTGHLTPGHRSDLVFVTDDAYSALNLWGFDHTAIAIGLMPVFLLAVEARLAAADAGRPGRGATAVAAIAGALVSWLHPWQGATLLGIVGALFVLKGPRRRYLALAVAVAATAAPLLYGVILSRADPAWRDFQARTIGGGTAPWWALIASFGPLAALGALGLRRPREDRDWMVLLWVLACAAVYFIVPEFPPHALSGVTLPLAVLAVRGWRRLPRPRGAGAVRGARVAGPALGLAAVLAFTVPAAVYHAQSVHDDFGATIVDAASRQLLILSPAQADAMAYIDHSARAGPVLAPWFLSMSVPAFTGREAYAGHIMWQPGSQLAAANQFFSSTLVDPSGARRQAILRASRAAYVIADCSSPAAVGRGIAPLARAVRRFGCVTVYETPGDAP